MPTKQQERWIKHAKARNDINAMSGTMLLIQGINEIKARGYEAIKFRLITNEEARAMQVVNLIRPGRQGTRLVDTLQSEKKAYFLMHLEDGRRFRVTMEEEQQDV